MKNSFDEKILDEAKDWLATKKSVILATCGFCFEANVNGVELSEIQ